MNTEDNRIKQDDLSPVKAEANMSTRKKNSIYISELRKKHKDTRTTVYKYLILLILYSMYQYILIPLSFIMQLIFLSNTIKVENSTTNDLTDVENIEAIKIIGWLLLFVLPLITFIIHGISIIIIQETFIMYVWISIVTLLESILYVPLSFLYENNLYSIFLYQERGYNQTLNPWLVFYPTEFVKDWIELVKQITVYLYFLITSAYTYSKIQSNISGTFIISISMTVIILNILKLIAIGCIIAYKYMTKKYHDKMIGNNKTDDSNKLPIKETNKQE